MKISRNNVSVTMSLNQFLNVLETDLFDEVLGMIDIVDYENTEWEDYSDEIEVSLNDEESFTAIGFIDLSKEDMFENGFLDELMSALNYVPSKEDLKVQRILSWFGAEEDLLP